MLSEKKLKFAAATKRFLEKPIIRVMFRRKIILGAICNTLAFGMIGLPSLHYLSNYPAPSIIGLVVCFAICIVTGFMTADKEGE